MNIRATSSAFMAFRPPWLTLALHADRLVCWKLGGFATAVICKVVRCWMRQKSSRDDAVGETVECSCVVDLPKHLNTTTSALRLNPQSAKLISNKQFLSSFKIDLRYAARCRTVLLDAVSCGLQVVGTMTMGRQALQRLATSPVRLCVGLRAM